MPVNLSQTTMRKRISPKPPKERQIGKNDDLIDLFPLPGYFQLHFEYIHDNTLGIKDQVNQLKQVLAKLEGKLG